MSGIFLKNGIVLIHDDNDKVVPTESDILIEGNVIVRVERGITPPTGVEIIDCTNKIVSPGFVDGHQHVWQTLNKGRHGDHTLLEYVGPGKQPPSCTVINLILRNRQHDFQHAYEGRPLLGSIGRVSQLDQRGHDDRRRPCSSERLPWCLYVPVYPGMSA